MQNPSAPGGEMCWGGQCGRGGVGGRGFSGFQFGAGWRTWQVAGKVSEKEGREDKQVMPDLLPSCLRALQGVGQRLLLPEIPNAWEAAGPRQHSLNVIE